MVMICPLEPALQVKRIAFGGVGEEAHVLKTQSGVRNKRLDQHFPYVASP